MGGAVARDVAGLATVVLTMDRKVSWILKQMKGCKTHASFGLGCRRAVTADVSGLATVEA